MNNHCYTSTWNCYNRYIITIHSIIKYRPLNIVLSQANILYWRSNSYYNSYVFDLTMYRHLHGVQWELLPFYIVTRPSTSNWSLRNCRISSTIIWMYYTYKLYSLITLPIAKNYIKFIEWFKMFKGTDNGYDCIS